jgi:hypothetical protein
VSGGTLMKLLSAFSVLAICLTMLTGCWFYSRPEDPATGCKTTTYGVAIASTDRTSCPDSSAPQNPPPSTP